MTRILFWSYCIAVPILLIACRNNPPRDSSNSLKEKLFSLIKELDLSDNPPEFGAILIIPVDLACKSCRDKCIAALKRGDLKPAKTVLSSLNVKEMKLFLQNHGIELEKHPNILLDTTNAAFKSDLAFVSPVLYFEDKASKEMVKIELTPINIDDQLSLLAGMRKY